MLLKEVTELAEIQGGQSKTVGVPLTLHDDTKHIPWNRQISLPEMIHCLKQG